MEVALVRWPSEAVKRDVLISAGIPVLLLVESEMPPEITSPIEDWIRVPSSNPDIEARVRALGQRIQSAAAHPHFGPYGVPQIDDAGVLRFGDRWVSLTPVEARLVGYLLETPGAVFPRQQLIAAGRRAEEEKNEEAARNTLDSQVLRLRRRLQPMGLTVRTVRSRGYILDRVDASALRKVQGP